MKTCSKCLVEKELNEFGKHKISKDGYRYVCKHCNKQDAASWDQRNPEKSKNRQLLKHYGINLDEYNKLFTKQNGCCAICEMHQANQRFALSVDHDHTTQEIRGLLCNNCNRAIGLLKDSTEVLNKAIAYLTHPKLKIVKEA